MSDYISSDIEEYEKNSWSTDPVIFNALDREFNFDLDAAATELNSKVKNFYSEYDNALEKDWYADGYRTVWINPPYGRGLIKQFMDKAIIEREKGVTVVLLVPNTIEASWLPLDQVNEIRLITKGRLSFYHPVTKKKISGNTKGSMFVIFRPYKSQLSISTITRGELMRYGKNGEMEK